MIRCRKCGKNLFELAVDNNSFGEPTTIRCSRCHTFVVVKVKIEIESSEPDCLHDATEHKYNKEGNCINCGEYNSDFSQQNIAETKILYKDDSGRE